MGTLLVICLSATVRAGEGTVNAAASSGVIGTPSLQVQCDGADGITNENCVPTLL